MNYQRHYDALIARARNRSSSEYTESHHVIPSCMGGNNQKDNLVALTAEEHYVAHQLLIKIYPQMKGLVFAALLMSGGNFQHAGRNNNKSYGWIRRRASIETSRRQFGKVWSDERKNNLSKILKESPARKAHSQSRIGTPLSPETRLKISAAHKTSELALQSRKELFDRQVGRPQREETKLKISAAKTGKPLSEEHKKLLSIAHTGKPKPRDQVEKIAAKLRGRVGTRVGAVTSEETKAKQRAAALKRYAKP